jgi:hypothetical protein
MGAGRPYTIKGGAETPRSGAKRVTTKLTKHTKIVTKGAATFVSFLLGELGELGGST